MITLPPNTTQSMLAHLNIFWGDLWKLLIVCIGVPLAFYIIQQVIKLSPKDKKEYYKEVGEKWWKGHKTTPPKFIEAMKKEKPEIQQYITKLDQKNTRRYYKE